MNSWLIVLASGLFLPFVVALSTSVVFNIFYVKFHSGKERYETQRRTVQMSIQECGYKKLSQLGRSYGDIYIYKEIRIEEASGGGYRPSIQLLDENASIEENVYWLLTFTNTSKDHIAISGVTISKNGNDYDCDLGEQIILSEEAVVSWYVPRTDCPTSIKIYHPSYILIFNAINGNPPPVRLPNEVQPYPKPKNKKN